MERIGSLPHPQKLGAPCSRSLTARPWDYSLITHK